MCRRLPISTAHLTRHWRTARQVRAAVAAVEDNFHRSLGWRCGGEDGEVGFWFDFLGVVGLVFGLPGCVAHGFFLSVCEVMVVVVVVGEMNAVSGGGRNAVVSCRKEIVATIGN